MSRVPRAVRILLIAAAVLAAGLASAALLALARPGLLLNSRSAAYLLKRGASAWEPRWTRLELSAAAPSLWDKDLRLTASDLCFRHAPTGSEGCLRLVDIRATVGLRPPRLRRVDRFVVTSGRLRLVAPAADPARGPRRPGLPGGVLQALRGARVDGVRVELGNLELLQGPRRAAGSVSVSLDSRRPRPLTARAGLVVDGRPLRVEASADSGAFRTGRFDRLDASWTAAMMGAGEASGRLRTWRRDDGGALDIEASGRWTAPSSSGVVRAAALDGCRGALSGPPREIRLDCAVRVTPGPSAPVRRVLGRASFGARFPGEDQFYARAGLFLDPVRDWYEASGGLRVRAAGRLGRPGEAALSHELEARLAFPRFEEFVRRAGDAVPAPFRPLRGAVELELKGAGDPRSREHRFTLKGRSRLAEGAQRLAASLTGTLAVRDPLLPAREIRAATSVVFDDVALAVPRLGGGAGASSAPIVALIRGKADVSARLAQGDRLTARASVDLGPVRDWYEASGRLRLSVEGRLSRLREARIEQDLEARLAVPRFEDLVERLRETRLAVPAPLNRLRGPVELEARGAGAPGVREQRLRLRGRARLAGGRQRLSLSASADVSVRDALSPRRAASAKGAVVLEDVALELPRLELGAPPDVTLDDRIAVSLPAPGAAGAGAPALEYEATVKTAKPALLYTNLAKGAVPVEADLVLRSGPRPLSGQLRLGRFETELFGRTASVEHFRLEPSAGRGFELDGLLLYKSAEAVVRILVLGSSAKPRVDLSSDPPLERPQIIALLLYNKAPEQLDAEQSESVGHAQSALASNAFGLASLYLFASTPVEYVGYDPAAKTYSLRVRVPGGATVELGAASDESKHVRLRKRLAPHWALQTEMRTREREGNIVTTFLEWFNRF